MEKTDIDASTKLEIKNAINNVGTLKAHLERLTSMYIAASASVSKVNENEPGYVELTKALQAIEKSLRACEHAVWAMDEAAHDLEVKAHK